MSVAVDRAIFQQALARRGLSQQDLALLAGLSESVVSSVARGRGVSGPTFRRVIEALQAAPALELGELGALLAAAAPRRPRGGNGAAGAVIAPTAHIDGGGAASDVAVTLP